MGSMITLGIDKFEIDWGKNNSFFDHSILYTPLDVKQIPYYYADNIVEMREGLSRSLYSISRRLDLLGYSLTALESIYNEHLKNTPYYNYYSSVSISFDQVKEILTSLDIDKIDVSNDDREGDYDIGKYVSQFVFQDSEVVRCLSKNLNINNDLGEFFENLDPYFILRLLAENDNNLDKLVQWRYFDVVEGGWINRDEVVKQLPPEKKILIVTEGTSDSFILERSINELSPDIADFFYFVDMEENYPFTGTGNVYRFCQGLTSIDIQNKVLVLLDNDFAGVETYLKCQKLKRPTNMHICKLPDHKSFNAFNTIGPNGEYVEDINGLAVAIECFLDLGQHEAASVRWTSYNKRLSKYQGELNKKDNYVKGFKKASLTDGSYNCEKLKYLIDHIFEEWVNK